MYVDIVISNVNLNKFFFYFFLFSLIVITVLYGAEGWGMISAERMKLNFLR